MTVDAAHAGHLVPHALGLQHVPDTEVVEPGLVTMAKALRGETSAQRQPGCQRHRLGGSRPGTGAHCAVDLVTPDQTVEAEPNRVTAQSAPATVIAQRRARPRSDQQGLVPLPWAASPYAPGTNRRPPDGRYGSSRSSSWSAGSVRRLGRERHICHRYTRAAPRSCRCRSVPFRRCTGRAAQRGRAARSTLDRPSLITGSGTSRTSVPDG